MHIRPRDRASFGGETLRIAFLAGSFELLANARNPISAAVEIRSLSVSLSLFVILFFLRGKSSSQSSNSFDFGGFINF